MKRVLLVGATDGIGRELARVYAERGSWLAVVGRNPGKLDALVRELSAKHPDATVSGVVCDLADDGRVEEAWHEALQALGHCDLLIYVAGEMRHGDGETSVFEDDRSMFQVNTVAAMHWLGLAANYFRAAGRGHIVGISSIAGDRGRKGNPAYTASKAALTAYLEALRNRLAPHGVTVTTVKPGFVQTKLIAGKKGIFWAAPAAEAAETIAERVASGDEVFYVYRRWWLVAKVMVHVPRFLFKRFGPP